MILIINNFFMKAIKRIIAFLVFPFILFAEILGLQEKANKMVREMYEEEGL